MSRFPDYNNWLTAWSTITFLTFDAFLKQAIASKWWIASVVVEAVHTTRPIPQERYFEPAYVEAFPYLNSYIRTEQVFYVRVTASCMFLRFLRLEFLEEIQCWPTHFFLPVREVVKKKQKAFSAAAVKAHNYHTQLTSHFSAESLALRNEVPNYGAASVSYDEG